MTHGSARHAIVGLALLTVQGCGPVVPEGYVGLSINGQIHAGSETRIASLTGANEVAFSSCPIPLKISLSAETPPGAVIANMSAPMSVQSATDVGSAWAGQVIAGAISASINVPKGANRRIVVWGVAQTCIDPQLTYPVYGVADVPSLTGGLLLSFSAYAMGPLKMYPTSNKAALSGTRFVELSLDGAGAFGRWIAIFDIGANVYLTAEPVTSAFALPTPPFIENISTLGYIRPLQPNRRYRFEFYNDAGVLQSRHCHRTQFYEISGPQQEVVTFSAATRCP